MALQVIEVLAKHGFNVGVIVNVKDYLSTMTNTLVFVVSCEVLGVDNIIYKDMLGACLCLSVANMPQMILKFLLA
jgi:hypothetical protein